MDMSNISNISNNDGVSNPEDNLITVSDSLLDAINSVIACLALLGNGLVITVMLLRRRAFSSFTNSLILHQSIIDAIAGIVFFFFNVVRQLPVVVSSKSNFYDRLICSFVYSASLNWCVNVTSTYNLVFISVERFVATCYPVKHRNSLSKSKLKFVIGASWAIGLVYSIHLVFIFEPYQGTCRVVEMGLGLQILVGFVVVATEYLVPLTIMVYAYTQIVLKLTRILGNRTSTQQNTLSKAKKNVLLTVFLSGILFVICWTPTELNYLDLLFFQIADSYQVYLAVSALLACNMFVNPIIYCFKYEHFRSQLRILVQKLFRRNRVHAEQENSTHSRDPCAETQIN